MPKSNKKFLVCRSYVTRCRWTVEAENAEAALAMMDSDDDCPMDGADEEWQGPVGSVDPKEYEDNVVEL